MKLDICLYCLGARPCICELVEKPKKKTKEKSKDNGYGCTCKKKEYCTICRIRKIEEEAHEEHRKFLDKIATSLKKFNRISTGDIATDKELGLEYTQVMNPEFIIKENDELLVNGNRMIAPIMVKLKDFIMALALHHGIKKPVICIKMKEEKKWNASVHMINESWSGCLKDKEVKNELSKEKVIHGLLILTGLREHEVNIVIEKVPVTQKEEDGFIITTLINGMIKGKGKFKNESIRDLCFKLRAFRNLDISVNDILQ